MRGVATTKFSSWQSKEGFGGGLAAGLWTLSFLLAEPDTATN